MKRGNVHRDRSQSASKGHKSRIYCHGRRNFASQVVVFSASIIILGILAVFPGRVPDSQTPFPEQPRTATTTFLSVSGNTPLYYIPINLTNSEISATSANMQQKIEVNPNLYSSYYASNLSNVNWQDGNGNLLNSWLESYNTTSAVYWINLGSNTISAGNTLTIYQVIYATAVNAMNNQQTGAYPMYTVTYGQYDNGHIVFPAVYYNFTGTTFPSTLNTLTVTSGSGVFSATANNGLTITGRSGTAGTNQTMHVFTRTAASHNIVEMYLASASLGTTASWELSLATSGPSTSGTDEAGFKTAYRYDWFNGAYRLVRNRNQAFGVILNYNIASLTTPSIQTLYWPQGGTEAGYCNYTQKVYSSSDSNPITFANSVVDVVLMNSGTTDRSFTINWLRTRVNPPSGVMPTVNMGSLTSIAISTDVAANPTPIDQTQNIYLTSNTSGGFAPYTFQWYALAPGAGSYAIISGATTANYTYPTTESTQNGLWNFKLNVTDSNETVFTSSAASVTINSALQAPTASATHEKIDLGQTTTLSSTTVTTGTGPTYIYQWLNSTTGGAGSYAAIPGATSDTYDFTPWTTGTWYFQLNVTDGASIPMQVTSNIINVTVNSLLEAPLPTANFTTIDQGQTIGLSTGVLGTGTAPYAYQWYSQAPGASTYTIMNGATTANYSFPTTGSTPTGDWNFKVNITDSAGEPVLVTSNAITVTIHSQLVAPTLSVDHSTINIGQSAHLSSTPVTTGTSAYSFQWLNSSTGDAGSYTAITGATSSTYTFTSWTAGTWYFQLNVTDSAGNPVIVTTTEVAIMVNAQLQAPTISVNFSTIDRGQSATLTSTAVSTGTSPYTYQWLNSTTGIAGSYVVIPGAIGTSYMFNSWAAGNWYFQLNVTDSAGIPVQVTSNAVMVTVNLLLLAPIPSANFSTINQGQNIGLAAGTVGTGTAPYTYQWCSLAPGAGAYSIIDGATTSSYSFPTTVSTPTGIWNFKVNVTDSAGNPVTVTTAAVSININAQLKAPSVSASYSTINHGQSTNLANTTGVSTGTPSYTPQWYCKAPGAGLYAPVGSAEWTYTFATTPGTTIGTWSFVLNVTDSAGTPVTSTSAAVSVVVNDIPQFAAQANNIFYTYGQTGNQLAWTIADTLTNVASYSIYANGTSNATGTWTAGVPVNLSVNNLGIGWYNYSIVVTDGYGGSNTTWAFVVVMNDNPCISQPGDLTYTYGQTNQALSWIGTDGATSSVSWTLYVNNTQNATGTWTPGIPITINVTGLGVALYNYSLVIDDGYGATNTSWAWVTVLNDAPSLNNPYNGLFSISAGQTTGNNITWIVTDGAYSEATWALYNNVTGWPQYPTANATGTWSPGVSINISVDGLSEGTWNWTIVAWDGLGGTCWNTVLVNVSTNPAPTITQPPDVVMMVGDTEYSITWTITDLSNDTDATYWVWRDGVELIETGIWTEGDPVENVITISLATRPVGRYNFTIIADNGNGMQSQDECNVTVNDNPIVTNPSSMIFNHGSAGNNLTWTASDTVFATARKYYLYIGVTLFTQGTWDPSTTFSVNLDGLSVGTFNYILRVEDGLGGQDEDSGSITVNDIPVLTQPGNFDLEYGAPGNNITWTVSDTVSGIRNYTLFIDRNINITNQAWNPGNPIVITVYYTAFGTYNYTLFVADGLNGTAMSTVWVTILDDTPVITTPADISYRYGTTGHNILWTVTHQASSTGTYIIYVDGIAQTPKSWTSGVAFQITVDGQEMGDIEFTCFVDDGQKNCSDTVIVHVLDDIPQVTMQPVTFTYGTQNNFIEFTIADTYLATTSYTVYVNDVANVTGTWLPGTPISLNVDQLWVGSFNYSIVITDGLGETNFTWAIVTVLDDIPQLSHPQPLRFYEDATGITIDWIPTDGAYSSNSYTIYINSTTVHATGSWSSGVLISINIDSLATGHYNISCVVNDGLGKSNVTYVLVIVDPLNQGVANPLTSVVQTHVQRSNATFSFVVFDGVTAISYPPALTDIKVTFGSEKVFNTQYLSWNNGTNNGVYNLTADTRNIPAGTYLLRITFLRQNYTETAQIVILTVEAYQPTVDLPRGIQTFTEGSRVRIPLSVVDIPQLNETFDVIVINWTIGSLSGQITEVDELGHYSIEFDTSSLLPNANYDLTISIAVTVDGETYVVSASQTVNVRVEFETIYGIPRPYFWITIAGFAAILGPIASYRVVKNARIPPFIKKLNRVRSKLKKQKLTRVLVQVPTRDETINAMRGEDLAAIGIKLPEKGKAEPIKESRNPEQEEVS